MASKTYNIADGGEECRDGEIEEVAKTRHWGNDYPNGLGRIEGRTPQCISSMHTDGRSRQYIRHHGAYPLEDFS